MEPSPVEVEGVKAVAKLALRWQEQAEAHTLLVSAVDGALFIFAGATFFLFLSVFWPVPKILTARGWWDGRTKEGRGARVSGLDRETLAGFCLFVLLVVCAVSQQLKIDDNRGFISDQSRRIERKIAAAGVRGKQVRADMEKTQYMYLPETEALPFMFLGNNNIAADYMWLTSLQYVSSPFRRGQKFKLMHRFYDAILKLDPHWIDIHVNAGKVLSALDPNRNRTEHFLRRAIVQNPTDYRLPYEAGLLWVVPPMDPQQLPAYSKKASLYFALTLEKRKSLPKQDRLFLNDLLGRLETESGSYKAAANHLFVAANNPDWPKRMREQSSRQWLMPDSLIRTNIWSGVVRFYRHHHKKNPESLTTALRFSLKKRPGAFPLWLAEGLDGREALDAYGFPIVYDPVTGKVGALGVQYLRAIQAKVVLASLLRMYHGQYQKHPANLDLLTEFTKRIYGPPSDPPFQIRESLGTDFNCSISPMWSPWNYKPENGTIVLPENCTAASLYQNQYFAMEGRMPPHFK